MIEVHDENFRKKVKTVVEDSRYGKINFLLCHDFGTQAHIRSLEETQRGYGRKRGIFLRRGLHTIRRQTPFVVQPDRY